jgi:hypothetical protein
MPVNSSGPSLDAVATGETSKEAPVSTTNKDKKSAKVKDFYSSILNKNRAKKAAPTAKAEGAETAEPQI